MKRLTRKEIDAIYIKAEDFMKSGRLGDMDAWIAAADVRAEGLDFALGILTASLPVKSQLKERPGFFKKVAEYCQEIGETDPTLLQGLG